jgi:hypothetical protein
VYNLAYQDAWGLRRSLGCCLISRVIQSPAVLVYNHHRCRGKRRMKAVTHALALGSNLRVSTEGSCNGFFAFHADRQGALANGLHGLNPRNTDTATHPAACRPALIKRLVKDWVQRWKQGPVYKRINPSGALGRCLFF